MLKRILYRAIHLSFAVILLSASLLFAQQPPPAEPPPNNTFTMTTYYPAPFGAYKKLTVSDSIGIGTTGPQAKLDVVSGVGDVDSVGIKVRVLETGNDAGISINLLPSPPWYSDSSIVFHSADNVPRVTLRASLDAITTNDRLSFSIGGPDTLVLHGSGNVGIGTTSPNAKLAIGKEDTSGAEQHNGIALNGHNTFIRTQNGARVEIDASNIHLNRNRPADVYIGGGGGSVKIGPDPWPLEPPQAKLDVFKSDSSATNNPGNPAIRVTATSGANSEFLSLGYDATLNKGYIQAAQAGVAWQDLLLNPNGGNVGIGTTTPANTLHIKGGSDTRLYVETSSGSQVTVGANPTVGGFLTAPVTPSVMPLTFWTSSAERIRIDPAGNVGIGTTSPSEKLHIKDGSIYIDGNPAYVFFDANKTYGLKQFPGQMIISTGINLNADVGGSGNGDSIIFMRGFSTELMRITNHGKVGIGITDPQHPIDVASGAHLTAGGVWTDASSIQYKQDVASLPLERAYTVLAGLDPVTFRYKADPEEKHVGFIAEDVPELVANKDRKGLSPMDIVAVLTKVVQEQQKRIEALEKRLNTIH